MEIPTKNIIEKLQRGLLYHRFVTSANARDAISVIRQQALEIRELQAVIVRMRDEYRVTLNQEAR